MVDKDTIKIFIISEDRSKNSFSVIKNIVSSCLKGINHRLDVTTVEFDDSLNSYNCIKAARWKDKNDHEFRNFMLYLMSELIKENAYVFWHIDADVPWSDIDKSENVYKFNDNIKKIPHVVTFKSREIPIDFTKLFLLFPSYSIESWLYAFIDKITLNQNDRFKLNREDYANFDEIIKIKAKSGIKDKYNFELSKKVKHKTLRDIRKSYFRSFEEICKHEKFTSVIKKCSFEHVKKYV